jgi:hypothetical protein
MRAMADIQAEGLRAASELLERILRSEPDGHESRSSRSTSDYAALVDAWADLLRRIAAGLAQPVEPGPVTVPVDSTGVGPLVSLTLPDSESTEVWLHNGTFSAVGPLFLRCGPLSASDGTVLDGAEVSFDPPEMAALPPRSSRAVLVSVRANGAMPPGIYRGTIQADGAPRLWLPLEVEVRAC